MTQFNVNLQVISNPAFDANALQGTAADFVARKAKINGVEVDAISMGVFAKFGLVKTLGDAPKVEGKRGRPGKIIAFDSTAKFEIEV